MDLSEGEIRKIVAIISSRLGPDAAPDEIKRLAAQVIASMVESDKIDTSIEPAPKPLQYRIPRKLVINALGLDKDGLATKLKSFIAGRALRLAVLSDTKLENLRSLVAIIDCTDYAADLNRLKFELASLCEESGFKAIVQDIGYYGV